MHSVCYKNQYKLALKKKRETEVLLKISSIYILHLESGISSFCQFQTIPHKVNILTADAYFFAHDILITFVTIFSYLASLLIFFEINEFARTRCGEMISVFDPVYDFQYPLFSFYRVHTSPNQFPKYTPPRATVH